MSGQCSIEKPRRRQMEDDASGLVTSLEHICMVDNCITDGDWVIDGGASKNVTGSRENLKERRILVLCSVLLSLLQRLSIWL
jgi:hypothetical protein